MPPTRHSMLETLWAERASEISHLAATLFDDPRLDPPLNLEKLVDQIRARIAVDASEVALDGVNALHRRVGAELLGYGHQLYGPALHRLLHGQVWSDDLVEELVQGALARAAERLDELLNRPRPLFGWLCQLVRQQRIDWLRNRSAHKRDAGRTVSLAGASVVADTGTTPTQAERRSRVREMFERVLAHLPAEMAAVLRLHSDEHLSPAEIAGRLGISGGDARIRLFRARRRALEVWLQLFPQSAAELAEAGVMAPSIQEMDRK